MTPDCRTFLPLIHQYLDDEITRPQRDALLGHLERCESCRNLLEDYRRISGELRAMPADVPPNLHQSIMGYVRRGGARPWYRIPALRRAAAVAACAAVLALVIFGPLRPAPVAGDETGGQGAALAEPFAAVQPQEDGGEGQRSLGLAGAPEDAPETTAEAGIAHRQAEAYSYYPRMDSLVSLAVGDGYDEDAPVFTLTDPEREALWPLLQVEAWEIATDLPATGFFSQFYLVEDNQVWFFNQYDEQTLVVPSSPDEKGDKVCYLAPARIIEDVLAYAGTLKTP